MPQKSRKNRRSRRSTRKQYGGVVTQLTAAQIDQIGDRLVTLQGRIQQMRNNMMGVLNNLEMSVFEQNFDDFIQQDNATFTGNQHERFRLIRTNNIVANNLAGMLDDLCNLSNPVRQLIGQFNPIQTGLPEQNGAPPQNNGGPGPNNGGPAAPGAGQNNGYAPIYMGNVNNMNETY